MEPTVDDDTLLAHLADEAALLGHATRRCDPAAAVPGLEWDVRTVATHTGAVHRWATDLVARALPTNETGGSRAFVPSGLDDAELPEWLADGATALVTTLRDAPADLECFMFLRGRGSRSFWIRRQAHETAVHRMDVEAAAGGPVTAVTAAFAQDGPGELAAFARQRAFAVDRRGELRLEATDGPAWHVAFGGERNVVTCDEVAAGDADAVVRGSSDELYRWAWNRPSTAVASGDPQVLDSWHSVRL